MRAKLNKVAVVMREYKQGHLHSGSKKGPVVRNPRQAIAIGLSEQRAYEARRRKAAAASQKRSGGIRKKTVRK